MGGNKNNVGEEPVKQGPDAIPLETPELEGPDGADFSEALRFTLKNEGGFSDHPADRGGATNWGITQAEYSRFLCREASKNDVQIMTLEDAGKIYKARYWNPLKLDSCVDQSMATCIFDMGVLCGTGTVAKWVQEICKVPQDGKVGVVTLGALNALKRPTFVESFANRAQSHFNGIVQRNPSQKVFLKGWTNRANRLRALAAYDEPLPPLVVTRKDDMADGLILMGMKRGFDPAPLGLMINWMSLNKPYSSPRYWAYFDTKAHSSLRRFHVFDLKTKTVESHFVAHGSGSDPDHNGILYKFSNEPGSNCTSKGIYLCAETYNGKHGRSLKLDGKESTNSNARSRSVVIHGAAYVGQDYVKLNGKCGRSQGCPALDREVVQKVIDQLMGGSPLIIA